MPSWMKALLRNADSGAGSGGSFFTPSPGGDSSAGDGGGSPPADGSGGGQPAEGGGEKLFAGKYKTPEDLETGYRELSGRFSTKTDLLKEQLRPEVEQAFRTERGAPEKPEAYAYPEGFQAPAETVDKSLRDWAHKNAISQDAFAALVKDVHGQTVANRDAEFAKLGDKAQAERRIDSVNKWIGKHVKAEHFPTVERILTTADGVAFFESIMDGGRSAGFVPDGGSPPEAELTRASIREMQADPKYGNDAAYTAKVKDAWSRYAKLPPERRK